MSMATENFPCESVFPLRSSLGMTQVELAERLGVSQPLVALWEKGDRVPSGPAAILLRQLKTRDEKKRKNSC